MSFFLPVVRPARCAAPRVVRNDFAPLFSLLDDTFNEVARASRHSRRPPFAPRFNVSEGKDYYSLEGELPGVQQENISVEFTAENTLTVKGRVEKHTRAGKEQQVEEAKAPEVEAETPAEASSETQSVNSHQATVEDEKEWEAVDTPATAKAQSEEASSSVAAPAEQQQVQQQQQQQQQPEQPSQRPWLSERFVGEFSRSFSFSERVDQEAVKASLNNGILSIVVPKAAKPENRKINIE